MLDYISITKIIIAKNKITTIEGLAELIHETMASKEDVRRLVTKEDLQQLAIKVNNLDAKVDRLDTKVEHLGAQVDNLDARVARIQTDIHELRGEIVYRHEFEDALGRIKYLEKKLGIESGV